MSNNHGPRCDCETCWQEGRGVYGRLNRIPGSPSVQRAQRGGGQNVADVLREVREVKAIVMELRQALLPPPTEENS